jgi:REP element-mobilizing transposase RayT
MGRRLGHRGGMARQGRDKGAGLFHVYTHSVWAAELFRDDRDRAVFLRELAQAGAKAQWTCVGFCLLTTHCHVIFDVEDNALPIGMHALNFRYAVQFNKRHRMKGHVLGARYDAKRIEDDEHLLTAYRYVMRNPVEAGICATAEAWRWSSFAAAIGDAPPIDFVNPVTVLSCLDVPRETAEARLRAFVGES